MFSVRPHDTPTSAEDKSRKLMDIVAPGNHVPLQQNWSKRWCILPSGCVNILNDIYEFEVRDDDVFVVTFPKSGTTWIQEAAWLLLNNLDFDTAKNKYLAFRSVFLELSGLYVGIPKSSVEMAANLTSPRLIKTHLPANLMPRQIWQKKTKIIYCVRNPKDVVLSYCHFSRGLGIWEGEINAFVDNFINDHVIYCPFWPVVLDFWQMRNESNVFFTTFESMTRDLEGVIRALNIFLEKPALTDAEMQKLVKHLSFENMRENKHTNPTEVIKSGHSSPLVQTNFEFMRRGVVGGYKDELSQENQLKIDQWTEEHLKAHNITLEDIFGVI